jgi:hypothetical protein
MKTFCITGPVNPEDHYFIPHRLDWHKLDQWIDSHFYFTFHAPQRSGKTTAILEYIKYLKEQGQYRVLYIDVEPAQAAGDDITQAFTTILEVFKNALQEQLAGEEATIRFINHELGSSHFIAPVAFAQLLRFWTKASAQPTVLFIDNIDSLVGTSLLSMLHQIRVGFPDRPQHFPQASCLAGLRIVRDYRIWPRGHEDYIDTGGFFNITAKDLTLENFSLEQVQDLYGQHTASTGQHFTPEAVTYAHYLTQGQPWLVNALAHQACFRDVLDRTQPITKTTIEHAQKQLVARRDTPIDDLIDTLNGERVRGTIDAIIAGKTTIAFFYYDDLDYVRDLGLIKQTEIAIANPLYQEIIPRALTDVVREMIPNRISWYLNKDGTLNMRSLMESFTHFFREHAQAWSHYFSYQESYPYLLFMVFLQRIIDGSGSIDCEYGLWKKRVDIGVTWPAHLTSGVKQQRFAIELKIKHGEDTLEKGLEQTAEYMDACSAIEGHLVIFNRDSTKTWEEKISNEAVTFDTKRIHVWTM